MSTTAVSLGDSCIDHYLSPIDKEFIGGNALNVAVHMVRAGLPCAYVGNVGTDQVGESILQVLRAEGVDVSHVLIAAGATKRVNIRLNEDHEPVFIHKNPVSVAQLYLNDETLEFIRQFQLVHTSWLGGAQAYLAALKGFHLQVSIDYGQGHDTAFFEETLPLADVAFYSLPQGTEEQARAKALQMNRGGSRLAVITRGRYGSLACLEGEFTTQPAQSVQVVDTLGAGDAFIGAFLASLVMGKGAAECLQRAARTAAHTCTHLGGWYGAEMR
jgi:fructoselysine 6-kinase